MLLVTLPIFCLEIIEGRLHIMYLPFHYLIPFFILYIEVL